MIYALDTNIISYILRGDTDVKQRWLREEGNGNQVIIPLIVYYEVMRGLLSAGATTKLTAFEKVCKILKVNNLTAQDVEVAARIYSERKKQGRPIEDTDLLIAAQSMSNDYTLVTNNTKHFENIEGLSVTNWKE